MRTAIISSHGERVPTQIDFTRLAFCSINLQKIVAVVALAIFCSACGGSSTASDTTTSTTSTSTVLNTQSIVVNSGPNDGAVNNLYTPVTICEPATENCQTIFNVLIDTKSSGLRILGSALSLGLSVSTDSSGNGIAECRTGANNSYQWGPVEIADIHMQGEIATSVPFQVVGAVSFPGAPAACSAGGTPLDNVVALGANGILGIGPYKQDCGAPCVTGSSSLAAYFKCPLSQACSPITMSLTNQLQNPVSMFPQDNNGVVITLPSISANGSSETFGSMNFGIGTQTDNTLGSAQVQTLDANGNLTATLNGTNYPSVISSAANAIFFPGSGISACPAGGATALYYCPATTQNLSALVTGTNGTSTNVAFSIANASSLFLFNNGTNSALANLGGPNTTSVIFGLPFFYGREVFVGFDGQTASSTVSSTTTNYTGPFYAY